MEVFQDYAYYYNMIYKEKNHAEEAKIVDRLIKKKVDKKHPIVLNIGCGTGRHDYEFSKLGYIIKGVDLSPDMINVAKDNYSDEIEAGMMSFEVGNFQTYETDRQYDIVTSLFHVISYQNSNKEVLDSFNTAYKVLKNQGVFVFDLWYGPGVLTILPENRIKRVENKDNILIRYANPVVYYNKNIVDVNYDVLVIDKTTNIARTITETHSMRYFFLPEIENMLGQCGFKLLEILDCDSLESVNQMSWTAYIIAEKI